MKIQEYQILYASTQNLLAEKVNAAIKKGWQPFGSPVATVTVTPDTDVLDEYSQAVVLYDGGVA